MSLQDFLILFIIFLCRVTISFQNPWSPLDMTVLTVDVSEGDDLMIECNYQTPYMTTFDFYRSFSWQRDQTILYDGNRSINTDENKYSVATEPNGVGINSLLVVENVTRFDAGNYACVFDENGATVTKKVNILHSPSRRYPHCYIDHVDNSTALTIGSSITLQCISDGYPPVNLSWHVVVYGSATKPVQGTHYVRGNLVENRLTLVLDKAMNTKKFVCTSFLTSDPSYHNHCEIGPIILATATFDNPTNLLAPSSTVTSTPAITQTSNINITTVHKTTDVPTTNMKSAVGEETVTTPYLEGATQRFTASKGPETEVIKEGNENVKVSGEGVDTLASIQCECKMDMDFFQLSFFLLLPVLLLSMLFNFFLCIKGFKVKSYPSHVTSELEFDSLAVIGNRRTETIMRNERETASNDYSLGDMYASINYATNSGAIHNNENYQGNNQEIVTEGYFDDDDAYFDGDGDYGYSHAVYDEPPPAGDDENANYYFDVPAGFGPKRQPAEEMTVSGDN